MLTFATPDQIIFAVATRAAGTTAITVQIFWMGQFIDASAIGDDLDTTLSDATRQLIPSMPEIGVMSIDSYLELAANSLKSLELN
jgi:hypothetical protein